MQNREMVNLDQKAVESSIYISPNKTADIYINFVNGIKNSRYMWTFMISQSNRECLTKVSSNKIKNSWIVITNTSLQEACIDYYNVCESEFN